MCRSFIVFVFFNHIIVKKMKFWMRRKGQFLFFEINCLNLRDKERKTKKKKKNINFVTTLK